MLYGIISPQLVADRFHSHSEGILPKGPYLPCVSMAGRALLAGYHRQMRYGVCAVSTVV